MAAISCFLALKTLLSSYNMSQKAGLQKAFFKKKKQCKILELYKLIICTNPVYFPNISFVIQQQNFVKSILKSITVYNENKNA